MKTNLSLFNTILLWKISQFFSELPFVQSDNYYYTPSSCIIPTKYVTDLGIILQEDLSFNLHMSDIIKRARNKLSWCLSVFNCRSEEVILTLYKGLVRPILEYCCVLWSPLKLGSISLLEGVQRTATSKIESVSHLNYWERLNSLGLMSLQRRRERYCLLYMHKVLHKQVPNDIQICFSENARLGIKAEIPPLPRFRSHIQLFDSSFAVRGPMLWNLLPKRLNNIVSFECFKVNLDRFLINIPDCPPTTGYTTANSNSLLCCI